MKYSVKTLRAIGLQARWTRNRKGAPIITARDPRIKDSTWWYIGDDMWNAMQNEDPMDAFKRFTLLGDIFSVPV